MSAISRKDRLIVALDVPTAADARAQVEKLGDTVSFYKIGLQLSTSGDYFTLDQFWKKKVTLSLTEEEVATIDRCLYDIPNLDNEPLPQIRHKFWPKQVQAH